MRILILSFYFEPDLSAGSFRTTALVNELSRKLLADDQVDVVTTFPNRYSSYSTVTKQNEKINNISISRVKLPHHKSGMLDQAKAFLSFYRQARKLTKNKDYDVVYATSSRLFTAFLGARVAKSKGIPLFLDIRDIFVDTLNDVLSKKLIFFAKPILTLIEKYTFKSAMQINLVSKGFESYFQNRYPGIRYSFYTNGIDEEFIELQSGNATSSNEVPSVVYAGNIGEGQGLHKILPALAKTTNGKFTFKIYGDGGLKDLLLNEIEKLQLNNIEVYDPIARKQLIDVYKKADVLFLHLNDYDAFKKVLPSKIFEYAAMGKPILAGVSGYAEKFIKTELNNAQIFSPCNVKEAEIALNKLSIKCTDRSVFVKRYSRKNIMKMLCDEIISLQTPSEY